MLPHFDHIHIRGFRRLKDVDLELRPLCVMIGANGSGKSSLLDAFSLLASSASGELNKKLSDLGGLTSIQNASEKTGLLFELLLTLPDTKINQLSYLLSISLSNRPYETSFLINKESLIQTLQSNDEPTKKFIESLNGDVRYYNVHGMVIKPSREINGLESALSQFPERVFAPAITSFCLSSCLYYHNLNVDQRSLVRLPQQIRPVDLPGHDGEDLIACLFSLREKDRSRFEVIEDTLRAAYPSFERLEFPPVATGMMAMAWRDRNFTRPFYMNELSEGMLRYLWLTTLLQSPNLPSITLLDEPEVSLHPELLRLLADQMREAAQRTQLFVATHADSLIRFLEPKEVLAFDLAEDGSAQATWADTFDLEEWLKDYTLDEVWRMGRMGGRA